MGAQVCGHDRGLDLASTKLRLSIIKATDVDGFAASDFESLRASDFAALGKQEYRTSYGSSEHQVEDHLDAEHLRRGYDSTAVLPALFELQAANLQDSPDARMGVHRATGVVRRILSVRKPAGAERQERLRAVVRKLQGLRADGVSRVFEVFEDCRTLVLVTENCTGGTVYDRILQRQYFAEQESAVLVRHVLQALASLHRAGLAHGLPTPDSFRFHSEQTHASLKLVDFGLDLRVHMWDLLGTAAPGGRDASRRTTCLQLWETCRLVFGAPEVVRPGQAGAKRAPQAAGPAPGAGAGALRLDLLAEAIDAHLEKEVAEREVSMEAADAWGAGAIAFLLLCGYPPFFAPCRYAILARIGKTDFSFDPPFWSKISEEAKDFVQQLLRSAPERRLSIEEALRHPWIESLADSSPSGSMLSSFALNLRRFYRTSLIEVFAANSFAATLSIGAAHDVLARCLEADHNKCGFLTATDLRQILVALNHGAVAEAIGMCFSRTLRHPGESYIDYRALLESARLRKEHLLEQELWTCFCAFDVATSGAGLAEEGRLSAAALPAFLQVPEVQELLRRNGVEAASLLPQDRSGAGGERQFKGEVDFVDLACDAVQRMPAAPPAA